MDYLLIAAILVVLVSFMVLLSRVVRTVVPGWRYELVSGGKIVKVLDQPGLYFVSPFATWRRVRTDDQRGAK
jgi:regulator of protease activity HflC (stomatin/prohibitin superfamily)